MKRTSRSPIIAVDDSDEDIFLFQMLLKKIGATAPFVPILSGSAALTWFETMLSPTLPTERPFVCFLDIKMPVVGGFEILQWIREHDAFAALPVVMLSSSDDERDLRRAADLGAQAYLTKYPSTAALSEILAHASTYADGHGTMPGLFETSSNLLHTFAAQRRA